jgi:DNA-formamidopyrimidine glycosylase
VPELPEVETTRRGIEPHVVGRRISRLLVHDRRLRWPVDLSLVAAVAGRAIRRAGRRAKYLLIETESGTLILHLGMSGSLRVLPAVTPRIAHDHVDIELDSGQTLRFNDPRRFGCLMFTASDPLLHPLLKGLAPEPLEPEFNAEYLWKISRRRSVAIKQLIMNARHQGHSGHGGEGRRHHAARLRGRGWQPWLLPPEVVCLRTRRSALPRVPQARQTIHAGRPLHLLVPQLPEVNP